MFDFQQISRYRENNRLEAKLATGGLPRSIWETYSAFANTYGGVILLGVEELPDHTLRVQGLLEPRELVDEFTALLQDPRVVSANLCDSTTVFSFIVFEQTVGKIKGTIFYAIARASKEYGTTFL